MTLWQRARSVSPPTTPRSLNSEPTAETRSSPGCYARVFPSPALRGVHMDIAGRLAVVTGGGTGMGRELVVQLAAGGCAVATCDVHAADHRGDARHGRQKAAPAVTVTRTHVATCPTRRRSSASATRSRAARHRPREPVVQQRRRRRRVQLRHRPIGPSGTARSAICWGGVYNCSRAFVPLLIASDDGIPRQHEQRQRVLGCARARRPAHRVQHREVRGEGLLRGVLTDLRVNAPHVKVAVVMPGHIGTGIVANTVRVPPTTRPAELACERCPTTFTAPRPRCPRGGGGDDHPRRGAQRRMAHPRG